MTKTQAIKILDSRDLKEWIHLCLFFGTRDSYSVYSHTRTWFGEVKDDSELDDAINELTVEEFMEYLSSRYDVVFDKEPDRYRMRGK